MLTERNKIKREITMSLLNKLRDSTQAVDTAAEMADHNGGGFLKDSGVYSEQISKAFLLESKSGAIGIYIQYSGDVMYDETVYISNREGDTFYSKDGKDSPMPSYVDMKKLNYILTGNMITSASQFKVEERIVKHFKWVEDPENEGKNKKVDIELTAEVLVDWIGKDVKMSVQMCEEEKKEKKGEKYVGMGVRAEDKDGKPYLEAKILNYFNSDTDKTASETLNDKESVQLAKDEVRLEKSPVRLFKAKKPKSGASASSSKPSSAPKKPSVF